jgi:hypothetical protein
MWVVWCLITLVGTCLLLSLIDRPAAWVNPRTMEELEPTRLPAPL